MQAKRASVTDLVLASLVVLLLLAVLAPKIVDKKIYLNESSAVATLRTIRAAQLRYAEDHPRLGFADNVIKLGQPQTGSPQSESDANLLGWVAGCHTQPCTRAGYLFAIDQTSGAPVTSFRITAVPQTPGKTGTRGFCSNESGVITADPAGGSACSIKVDAKP